MHGRVLPSKGILAEVDGINLATFSEKTVKLRSIVIPAKSQIKIAQ